MPDGLESAKHAALPLRRVNCVFDGRCVEGERDELRKKRGDGVAKVVPFVFIYDGELE